MSNRTTHHSLDESYGRIPLAGLRRTKVMGTFRKMLREMTRQLEPEDAWLLINEIISTKDIPEHELDSVPAKQRDD